MHKIALFLTLLGTALSLWAQTPTTTSLPLKATLLRSFNGHQGNKVEYITFNATGDKFATAGFDKLIHIVDIKNNTDGAKVLSGHAGGVNHVAFNRSGTTLVSAANDGLIKVWDVATGTLQFEFANAPTSALFREAYFVIFSPDEKYLYFGGKNSRIQRVAFAADAKPETVYNDNYHITCAILSPDNRYLVFGCAYEVLCLDLNTNKITKKFTGANDFVNDIQISPDGKTLAAWTEDGYVKMWDYVTGKEKSNTKFGNKGYSHISFSKDGRYIVGGNALSNAFKLYATQDLKPVLQNAEHHDKVRAVRFSPTSDNILLTGSYDGSVRVWEIQPNDIVPPIPPVVPPVLPIPPTPPTPPVAVVPKPVIPPVTLPKPPPIAELPPKAKGAVTPPPAQVTAQPAKIDPPKKTTIEFNDQNIPTLINNRSIQVKSNIPVRATRLSLEIFDDAEEDGDIVTVYINDKLILEKYPLTKQKKVIPIEISATEPNVLILYSVNMGKTPPATVAIRILDGISPQMIKLSSDPKESQAFGIYLRK